MDVIDLVQDKDGVFKTQADVKKRVHKAKTKAKQDVVENHEGLIDVVVNGAIFGLLAYDKYKKMLR